TLSDSLTVRKQYEFTPGQPYQVDLTVNLVNESQKTVRLNGLSSGDIEDRTFSYALRWGPGFGRGRSNITQFGDAYVHYQKNGDAEYLSPSGGGGLTSLLPFTGNRSSDTRFRTVGGPVEWAAVSNRYFLASVIPEQPFGGIEIDRSAGKRHFVVRFFKAPFDLIPGESQSFHYDLYLGPKHYGKLQSVHSGLEATLNYGWFSMLSYPILLALRWIYAVIPNYGIAIIVLSLGIKFLLYPLTKKGLTSMRKMKQLQPKLEELQEKYSDDREKLNEKMMEFYQEHDVTPMGGCFPMLLQLPILIALYRMLEYSIELRGAPFMLWIHDLSAPDPYYVLPVIMGATMFAQQSYSVTAMGGGGQQQKMMRYVMPGVMMFIFMRFPAGLLVYYTTRTAATLVQYRMIGQSMETVET
ncbi:MAG: membrane protein insertase YidC, partial [bacterium]